MVMESKSSLIRLSTSLEVDNVLTKDRRDVKSVLLERKAYRQANCNKEVHKIISEEKEQ